MEDQFTLNEKEFQKEKQKKVAKPLLWIGILSIVMIFASLTSAVLVREGDGDWVHYEIPSQFMWSCITVLFASIFLILSNFSAKKDQLGLVKAYVGLTMLSGLLFVALQVSGAQTLYENGTYFTGKGHNASGSYFYLISFVHLLHLAGGIIALSIVFFNALKGRYNSENLLGLQVCSTYWHFLGGLWIYLYVFFRIII